MTLTFRDWNGDLVEDANIIEVEKADINPIIDIHISSVECNDGWWEIWNICGELCAYWEEDETV